MSIIRVLSSNGDDAVVFTRDDHAEAQALFERLRGTHVGFNVTPDATPTRMKDFDPNAAEIVMAPKIVGG